MSLVEAGRREPSMSSLSTIASRLGTTAEYLRTGKEPEALEGAKQRLAFAEMTLRTGDPHVALAEYSDVRRSLNIDRDRALWRTATYGLARANEVLNQLPEAANVLEELLAASGPDDADPTWIAALVGTVRCYREAGDNSRAQRLAERALAQFDELGNPGGPEENRLAAILITSYYETGDYISATLLADRTLTRAQELDNPKALAAAYWSASQLAQGTGQTGLALDYAERARSLLAELDSARDLAMVTVHKAWILLQQDPGNAAEALALLLPLAQPLEDAGDDLPLAYYRLELARANLHLGDLAEATVLAIEAGTTFERSSNTTEYANTLLVRAQAARVEQDIDECTTLLQSTEALLDGETRQRSLAATWRSISREYELLDQPAHALRALQRSADACGVPLAPSPPARQRASSRTPVSSPRPASANRPPVRARP